MKKYEGLFILNTPSKEDGIKEIIDRVSNEITGHGGKVQTVQKMDKRPFTRVADRKHSSGFYVNIIFECETASLAHLKHRFVMDPDVFRVMFTEAPKEKPEAQAA